MRKRSFRVAVSAAVACLSAFLLACPVGGLRIEIPDFVTSDVKGMRLYRVDDNTGALVDAGHIEFLGLETPRSGEVLRYQQWNADGTQRFGPLYAPVVRDAAKPAAIQINVAILNDELPPGWFKIASYNLIGTSQPSTNQTFVTGVEG